jgi:hypothetical protein
MQMNVSGEQSERKANIMQPENIESYPLKSCHFAPEGSKEELEHHAF